MEGFGLKVDLKVEGVDDAALIQAAHDVRCQTKHCRSVASLTILSSVLSLQSSSETWNRGKCNQGVDVVSVQCLCVVTHYTFVSFWCFLGNLTSDVIAWIDTRDSC